MIMDAMIMDALIACEESQEVCKALRALGHKAYSCDVQDCSGGRPEWHIKDDAIKVLNGNKWDLVIAHPPCTRLTNAGVRWLTSLKPRKGYVWNEKYQKYINENEDIWAELARGITFFNEFQIYGMQKNKIAIENPIPHTYARDGFWVPDHLNPGNADLNFFFTGIKSPTQIIQPYEFGHLEKKATGLWLYGLPELTPTNNVYDEMMKLPYGERAKVHYASPGPERAKIRAKTFTGVAKAMAAQWGQ